MAKKRSRDPHAAGDVLKSVLDKHHRQRETRNYDPNAHKAPETCPGVSKETSCGLKEMAGRTL